MSAFLCTTNLVPGGVMGILLKSKVLCIFDYTEMVGLTWESRRRSRMTSVWGDSLSQNIMEKFGSVPSRADRK